MKRANHRIICILAAVSLIILIFAPMASGEQKAWDCPECGRTGNTGNYCGGCAHPAPWIAQPSAPELPAQDFRTIGNIVTFGRYEQDSDATNGPEEIEWIVLDFDEKEQKALLLSKYGLDAKPYNTEYMDITWEQCSLRAWLNGVFLHTAFTSEEQSAILTTAVDNSSSQGYSQWQTDEGKNTQDQIFLLSYAEANRYLDVTDDINIKARVAPTAYAVARGAYCSEIDQTFDGKPAGRWWLRSSGYRRNIAPVVFAGGSLSNYNVDRVQNVVRPAFWINLGSDIF